MHTFLTFRPLSLTSAGIGLLLLTAGFPAYAASFSDVSQDNPAFQAIEYLKEKGVLSGYPDGTFKPKQAVKRAEAVKIIVAARASIDELKSISPSAYTDIAADAWYLPYVSWADQKMHIIDPPSKSTSFNGDRPVKNAEFLKIFLLGSGADPHAYSEIKLPLSSDVTDVNAWYYELVRLSIATSVLTVRADGMLAPDAPLTRGDVAQYLYRYDMYLAGRRTQALLSETETDIVNLLKLLETDDITQAEYASARALVAARGALTSKPDVPIVKAALKIAESFRSLMRGYRAGIEGKLDDTIQLAKEAWNSSAKALELSPDLENLVTQVQELSKKMADDARALQAQP